MMNKLIRKILKEELQGEEFIYNHYKELDKLKNMEDSIIDYPKKIYINGGFFPSPKKLSEAFDIDYYRSKYGPPEEEPNKDVESMTKEDVKEWGSQYFSQFFFRKFSPKTYNYAMKKRWLHDICYELEWDECGGNNKKIYGFFFKKDGQEYVYVGITNNITRRFRNHTDLAKTKLSYFQKKIKEMEVDPKDIDFRVLFWKFLDDYRSGQIERSLISYFRSQPEYICLNVASGGSTGEKGKTTKIVNYVTDLIAKEKIENEEEFKKLYPKDYDYLKGTNKLKLINKVFNYRFFDQGHYTNDEIFNSAKKYLNKKDFQKNEPKAFGAALRRNMLDDLFPENINESESVNDKVSLAKSLIYQLFDEVNYIKISEYHGKPLIKVYFDSDDTAANIESFFTHEICDTLKDYTGGEIVCNPSWGPEWKTNRNNPDILIDAIQLEYDDEGNVINESKEYNTKVVERNLKVIKTLLSLVSWDGLCDIWVEYNPEDEDYEIRSKTTASYFGNNYVEQELDSLENSLRSMGIKIYTYTPWYVENCEDEPEFLNEDYSPAGKEIIPNEIVVHKSNPIWRKNILETGLQVSVGECYKTYVGYGEKCIPAIFATNSTNKRAWFDSTYDDDIWFINTKMIPDVKWYKDKHFESTKKHIVTFENIPPEALTLKYQGSGSDKFLKESENKKSNYVNVIKQLVEPFKDEDCVCDINVSYDEEDDMYSVYVVTSTEELNGKFFYVDGIRQYLLKLRVDINKTIVGYLPIENLYVGSYGKPNCEWNPTISEAHKVGKDKFKITWK